MHRVTLIFVLTMTVLLGSSGVCWSADLQKGLDAYKRGDYAIALKELMPLAEQGDAYAQFTLGYMYAEGQGVPQDDQTALKWYTLAAEQGYAPAQFNLGVMYYNGQGVPQDYVRAHMWFNLSVSLRAHMWWNLSASTGDESAIKNRDIVAKIMTPAQIAEAQKLARECVNWNMLLWRKNYKGC